MNRREFLKLGAATFGLGATVIALDKIGGGKGKDIVTNKLVGASEVLISLEESQKETMEDCLLLENINTLKNNEVFKVSSLEYTVSGKRKKFSCKLITFNEGSNANIMYSASKRREDLLASHNTAIVAPLGHVKGNYHRDNIDPDKIPQLDFVYPARTTDNINLGGEEIKDRFPGQSPELNRASGGIVIKDGKIVPADQLELVKAASEGQSFAQLVYYIDSSNEKEVLEQVWSHFGQEVKIGNTSYYWGAYAHFKSNNEDRYCYIVADDDMMPICYMTQAIKSIADDGIYQMAFTDAGNGSSILCKDDRGKSAYGINGFDTHLTPAAIVVA